MALNTTQPTLVSIIAPLFNEEDSVEPLYNAIKATAETLPCDYQIIFVNDGSKDQTIERCRSLAAVDPHLKIIDFRKNYGQTPAMAAGIDNADGDVLVTMDGDLQNDPSDIPMMLEKLKEGYDIVVGWRHNRQDKLISRKIPSVIANRLIGKVTGVPIKDNGCSLKVYRADLMKSMPFYSEMHRFIPALLSLAGARVAQVKVKHHARQFGESKYGLSRIYKVLLDLLTMKTILSVSHHPARWFAALSSVPFAAFLIFSFFIAQEAAAGNSIVVMLSCALCFFSLGGFLFGLGLLSELIYQRGNIEVHQLAMLTMNQPNGHNSNRDS